MDFGGVQSRSTLAQSPPESSAENVTGLFSDFPRTPYELIDAGMSLLAEKQAATIDDFTIPELPRARLLTFVLLSPWDDPFYIGLDAIEIFTADGIRPDVERIETNARESYGDVRSLLQWRTWPSSDPRTMWMCKYRGCSQEPTSYGNAVTQLPITITVTLKHEITIAMIRIWNYSESRVHAPRGVCRMRIDIDGGHDCIFRGEISCAFTGNSEVDGGAPDQRPMGDTILFTTNAEILAKIAEHDAFLDEGVEASAPPGGGITRTTSKNVRKTRSERGDIASSDGTKRGKSAENFERTSNALNALQLRDREINSSISQGKAVSSSGVELDGYERVAPMALASKAATFNINALADIKRPATGSAVTKRNAADAFSSDVNDASESTVKKRVEHVPDENANPKTVGDDGDCDGAQETTGRNEGISGKVFHMELLANWGASDLIGLTGIQFLGPRSEALSVDGCVVRYSDSAASGSSAKSTNNKSLLRLLNGNNLTCSVDEMWLHDWKADAGDTSGPPTISFNFAKEVRLGGVSIWNYNASSELSYCGVKCVQFYVNGRPICGPVLLRRGPGSLYFDYVQDVLFDRCHLFRPLTSRPTTKSISSFLFELRLLSSWSDEYYIGLNGVELYNRKDKLMRLKPQNLAAFPESVNVLPSIKGDPRSSDKLIDNVNDTTRPHHMWLTPLLPNGCARIFFIFDAPEFVSRIRIYNYRKTPDRGVRHIAIIADDLIIFSGEVPKSSVDKTGILDVSLRDLD